MTDEPHIAVLMFIAHRNAETRVFDAVRNAGFDRITLAQARIAARLGPDGTRLSELADQARVSKQTASHLVDQLERAGYVERVVDPADARARLVRVSPRGEEMIAVARAVEAEIDAEWTKHLGVRRMRELRQTLTLLREITDPYLT